MNQQEKWNGIYTYIYTYTHIYIHIYRYIFAWWYQSLSRTTLVRKFIAVRSSFIRAKAGLNFSWGDVTQLYSIKRNPFASISFMKERTPFPLFGWKSDGWKKVGWFDAEKLKSKMSNFSHFLEYPLSDNLFVSPTIIGVILLHYTQTCRNPLACGYVINVYCRTPTVQCD